MSEPITPLNPQQTAAQEQKAASEGYFKRILVCLDQDINVDTGGLPDETISARAARLAANGKGFSGFYGRWMCRFLNLWQKNHGPKAIAGDDARARRVAAIEETSGEINQGT